MKIERDRVVEFHYDLRSESGDLLESSRDRDPVALLHGHGNVVEGVERALRGRSAGERFEATVSPEQGYGIRRDGWTRRISKKHFPGGKRLRPGDEATIRTEGRMRTVTVLKVGGKMVDVDLNHPMAGRSLHFQIEILAVRAAEPEEVAHGHVHGAGGHHHRVP